MAHLAHRLPAGGHHAVPRRPGLSLGQRPQLAQPSIEDWLSFGSVGAVYVLTLIHGVLLRRGLSGRVAAYIQVVGDLIVATALVYLSGGPESPFTFIFPLTVFLAAILLPRLGTFLVAGRVRALIRRHVLLD